jgi:hypothetical protein
MAGWDWDIAREAVGDDVEGIVNEMGDQVILKQAWSGSLPVSS